MSAIEIDPRTTALVCIDLQEGIAGSPTEPHAAADVVARAARLAAACRRRGALVVLVRVDPGRNGELFPRVLTDSPPRSLAVPESWTRIVPELGPEEGDVVVTKHQPSAFFGTDLDVHLRRRGIRTLLLAGISTNVGVEATARTAFEHGYHAVFAEDAMSARNADLHEHAVHRFFPTIGRVRSTDEIIHALSPAPVEPSR